MDSTRKLDIVQILLQPSNYDEQWRDNLKFIKEAKELEQCTFKPKISEYESTT